MLVRNEDIDAIHAGIGPAHLMDVDTDGVPFKYRTVVSLSDAFDSYVVVSQRYDAPEDTPSRNAREFLAKKELRYKQWGSRVLLPPGSVDIDNLISTRKVQAGVSVPRFFQNQYSLRIIADVSDTLLFDRYFRNFMVNPYLSMDNTNITTFIDVENGLRGRRIQDAMAVAPTLQRGVPMLNQHPPAQDLELPKSWFKGDSVLDEYPKGSCTIVPAIEFSGIACLPQDLQLCVTPIRFLFGDMLMIGLNSVPVLVAPKLLKLVQRSPLPKPKHEVCLDGSHMLRIFHSNHAGYSDMHHKGKGKYIPTFKD